MYKILRLTAWQGTRLDSAEYLPEYDAILLDPSWPLLGIPPGQRVIWETPQRPTFDRMQDDFGKRSRELWQFLVHGGILVVRVTETSTLVLEGVAKIDSMSWWLNTVARAADVAWVADSFVQPGSGTTIAVIEPGHPFEGYLRATASYSARLSDQPNSKRGIVLATNRSGDPVAVEMACMGGAVILVPPPIDEGGQNLFDLAVHNALTSRLGIAHEWTVSDERALQEDRDDVLRRMRDERGAIEERLARVRELKAGILELVHVSRCLGYYRQVTNGTATPKRSIPPIWSMLEMLRARYNKGYSGLAALLELPKDDLEFVNDLANRRNLDVRHTDAGQPQEVKPEEVSRALTIAKAIVQGVIEYEYQQLRALAPPQNGERKTVEIANEPQHDSTSPTTC